MWGFPKKYRDFPNKRCFYFFRRFIMAKFVQNEKVLAFHGPLIYEAKIQKVAESETSTKYLIHYHGWNKNWDEWVPDARILKYTESNLERKRELIKAHDATQKAKKQQILSNKKAVVANPSQQVSTTSSSSSNEPSAKIAKSDLPVSASNSSGTNVSDGDSGTNDSVAHKTRGSANQKSDTSKDLGSQDLGQSSIATRKGKRNAKQLENSSASAEATANSETTPATSSKMDSARNPTEYVETPPDNTVETEEQFKTKVEIRIKIPDELKPYLVDDWDYLTRQRKLVLLPARVPVEQIIQDYIKYKSGSSKRNSVGGRESAITEVTSGLKEYFNVMLGSQLLYKFEREQHADTLKKYPDTPMAKIYGAIHLLRLFVKLGPMLTYTPLDEKSVQLLLYYINDFLMYMKKNASTLFMIQDYTTAPPEYHRRAL